MKKKAKAGHRMRHEPHHRRSRKQGEGMILPFYAYTIYLQLNLGKKSVALFYVSSTASNPSPLSSPPEINRASMNRSLLFLVFAFLLTAAAADVHLRALASPTGTIVKHLSSVMKWTKSSPKATQSDGKVLLFESGYLVETLVEGKKLGVVPHMIKVSPEGELFAVDATNHYIVRITPPLSQYSRARLVAGSFQGYSGHVDGKPTEARFYHPKGVAMDDKGNVYVADTANLVIRKISEAGVTTIAGGKSNVAGYRDGPSRDAKFSNDFDVVYVGRTCSLLVVDRGNAALRHISLQQEDCEQQYSSVSTSDIIMIIGAVLAGYVSCFLQHGFGSSISQNVNETCESIEHESRYSDKPALIIESLKEEPSSGWPSFGRIVVDLCKLAAEAICSMLFNLIPLPLSSLRKTDLTNPKDRLVPEDKLEPPVVQKKESTSSSSMPETLYGQNIINDTHPKPQKSSKTAKLRDPSLSSKHRSSKRQDYVDFYGSAESQPGLKSQKDKVRHRHRDKSGEVYGTTEPKSVDMKPDFGDPKFEHYNIRSKYGLNGIYRY